MVRPNTARYDERRERITITNTNTGKKVSVDVASQNSHSITVYLAHEKIVLYKNNDVFVGNKAGMELTYKP